MSAVSKTEVIQRAFGYAVLRGEPLTSALDFARHYVEQINLQGDPSEWPADGVSYLEWRDQSDPDHN